MVIFVGLISFFLVLFEGSMSSLPVLLVFFLCVITVWRKMWIFPFAVLSGALLDVMQLRPMGETGLFLVIFLFLVLLYERKYETDSLLFILFSSFFGSFLYLLLFGYRWVILQAVLSCIFAVLLYLFFHIFGAKNKSVTL